VKTVKRLFWPAVLAGLAVVVVTEVRPAYVFAPLLGYGILRLGLATFGSLQAGASYIPDGPARPVDTSVERTTYWCSGCGAELLLLMRGAAVPPRHCGERMHERTEIARERFN
jgi:DNA-directed RNA polymerase subunit RPC12/RpoP